MAPVPASADGTVSALYGSGGSDAQSASSSAAKAATRVPTKGVNGHRQPTASAPFSRGPAGRP